MSQTTVTSTLKLLFDDVGVVPSRSMAIVASFHLPEEPLLADDLGTLVRVNDARSSVIMDQISNQESVRFEVAAYRMRRFSSRPVGRDSEDGAKSKIIIEASQRVMDEMITAAAVEITHLNQFLAIITVECDRGSALRKHLSNRIAIMEGFPTEIKGGRERLRGRGKVFALLSNSLCKWTKPD